MSVIQLSASTHLTFWVRDAQCYGASIVEVVAEIKYCHLCPHTDYHCSRNVSCTKSAKATSSCHVVYGWVGHANLLGKDFTTLYNLTKHISDASTWEAKAGESPVLG